MSSNNHPDWPSALPVKPGLLRVHLLGAPRRCPLVPAVPEAHCRKAWWSSDHLLFECPPQGPVFQNAPGDSQRLLLSNLCF